MVASKLDPVAQNSVWEEHVRKENRTIKLGTTFNITDPRKMTILPEKPNHIVPQSNPSLDVVATSTATLTSMSCLKDTDKLPQERFALPLTGNMEYGFFSSKPLISGNPMFNYPTKKCDVTQYADTYVQNAGASPYARKDGPTSK